MTPDEQRLIDDLFDRLNQQGQIVKDRQADALIQQRLRQLPDAAYMLVQSTIVYQHQIAANEDRIRELEDQLNSAADEAPSGAGSFLGGLLGGGREPQRPLVQRPEPQRAATSPWGGSQTSVADRAPPARGGGFLSSALSTATGVAGGMMIAESLKGLFGGSEAHARDSESLSSAADRAALKDADQTQDELQDQQLARDQQDDADDDAGYDSGGDDGIDV